MRSENKEIIRNEKEKERIEQIAVIKSNVIHIIFVL